jgi:hypothetical protein
MKTHLEGEVWLHVFLTSPPEVVSSQPHSLKVLRSEKQRPVHAGWNVFWAPKAVWLLSTKDKLLASSKTE